MFVILNNNIDKKVSPAWVNKWINDVRDDGFSPQEAMKALELTNFFGNIKKIVSEIGRLETAEERLAYKEFVLSAVERRETSPDSLEMLRNLAIEGGYVNEFDEKNALSKVYGAYDVGFKTCVVTDLKIAPEDYNESGFDSVIFECEINKNSLGVLPKHVCLLANKTLVGGYVRTDYCEKFIVPNATEIDISYNLPKVVWFGDCKNINLTGCNMERVEQMPLADGAKVIFNKRSWGCITKFPKILDLRNVDGADLSDCDLEGCENIIFGKKKKVSFYRSLNACKNISGVLDLSEVDEVDLTCCDLSNVTEIKFKKGAKVKLSNAKGLPENIDFSELSEVTLFKTDLSRVKKLNFCKNCKIDLVRCDIGHMEEVTFDEGCEVNFSEMSTCSKKIDFSKCKKVEMFMTTLPNQKVDLSGCRNVEFRGCDFSNVEVCFGDNTNVYMFRCEHISDGVDLSRLKTVHLQECKDVQCEKFVFAKGADVELDFSSMPKFVDAGECESLVARICSDDINIKFPKTGKVNLEYSTLPEVIDLSMLDSVDLSNAYFMDNKKIKFKDGAKVCMKKARSLKGVLDFSHINSISLEEANLEKVSEIKFKPGADVNLRNAKQIYAKMDLSQVKKLDIFGVYLRDYEELDFSNVEEIITGTYTTFPKNIRLSKNNDYIIKTLANENVNFKISKGGDFKFGAEVSLPKRLDLSELEVVDFCDADLSDLEICKFMQGARVKLDKVTKYPAIIDLSECGDVVLDGSRVKEMNTIVFKDEAQRDKVMETMKFDGVIDKIRFKRKCEYAKKSNNRISIKERGRCL